MQLRELGASGLLVSPICLGTMTFGEPVAEADAVKLVHAAIDMGVNFIDTANVYEGYKRVLGSAGGVAEEIVGKALLGRRNDAVLATKVGAPLGAGPQDRGLSASHILREVEQSLRRLQTDVIDLYIVHWPDKHTPLETTMAAIDQCVRQGKVRYFGASNHSAAQLCEMLWLADANGWPRVVSSQIPYSMLRREFHNDLPFCAKHQIGVTPYQSLQGGLLTGKYRRSESAPADSRLAEKPAWMWELNDGLYDQLEGVEQLAGELDISPARYTLAWTLQQPAMSSLVVGAKRAEQVADAVAASQIAIPEEHFERVDQVCPPPWRQPDPIR
ncbi:MAG: aldo/keto reductase [Pirellulaceae bacterium]|jgi:aryl-alcohol dehydrogenase-like predicted oxidoreductase|nr:aldo/keto reductase [Pirellulaceae bacterium]MDP7016276.1 aldo/keto reductase [Pirellulaceae bacterium]